MKLTDMTEELMNELYEDLVRHRELDIDGCSCTGCLAIRQRQYEENQHRLFRKALRGIRQRAA